MTNGRWDLLGNGRICVEDYHICKLQKKEKKKKTQTKRVVGSAKCSSEIR